MAQQVPNQPPVQPEQQVPANAFNQASLDGASDRLQELKLEEGKSTMVAFIDNIPGIPFNPPFVYCKVHWNSEMGDNGRMYQCFGGSCCEQVTWQKGWGGQPGKFEKHKARTRYFIPVIHYEQDQANPIAVKATVKFLNVTWSAYNVIVNTLKNAGQEAFFKKDVKLEAQKINGALVYQLYLSEAQAQWLSQPIFTQQVEEQRGEIASRLLAAMPKLMTEAEFLEMKPELDKKLQVAMSSYNQQNEQSTQAGFGVPAQAGFAPMPQQQYPGNFNPMPQQQQVAPGAFNPVPGQTVTQQQMQAVFSQPQVNIPFQPQMPQTTGVEGVPQTVGVDVPTQQVQTQATTQTVEQPQATEATTQAQPFETPKVDLAFDPSVLMK